LIEGRTERTGKREGIPRRRVYQGRGKVKTQRRRESKEKGGRLKGVSF